MASARKQTERFMVPNLESLVSNNASTIEGKNKAAETQFNYIKQFIKRLDDLCFKDRLNCKMTLNKQYESHILNIFAAYIDISRIIYTKLDKIIESKEILKKIKSLTYNDEYIKLNNIFITNKNDISLTESEEVSETGESFMEVASTKQKKNLKNLFNYLNDEKLFEFVFPLYQLKLLHNLDTKIDEDTQDKILSEISEEIQRVQRILYKRENPDTRSGTPSKSRRNRESLPTFMGASPQSGSEYSGGSRHCKRSSSKSKKSSSSRTRKQRKQRKH